MKGDRITVVLRQGQPLYVEATGRGHRVTESGGGEGFAPLIIRQYDAGGNMVEEAEVPADNVGAILRKGVVYHE